MNVAAGTRFERYEVLSPLGKGGMGEVYLALDTRLKRKVALKLLPAAYVQDAGRLHRFEQEAQAASALNHPNIITVHEIGEAGGTHFIATEFIEGRTLRQRISSRDVKLIEAIDLAAQTASALAEAHAAGILHRDIKPENVMIRPDGLVKVLDFGLAKLTESPVDMDAPTADPVNTESGVVIGTPRYLSPEQARGLNLDARTDIFSLGATLYEMITGSSPFEGRTSGEIMGAILYQEQPPLTRVEPATPVELERIVSKALEKDRDKRYPSAKEMLLDLQRLKRRLEFETEQALAGRPAAGTVKNKRNAALGLTVALLVVAVIVYWFSSRGSSNPTALDSIAVMPFENLTHDQKLEYLSDGVTESLINSLSQLPHIKVIARNSVFAYKNQTPELRQVAQKLNVRTVLTGRVLAQGDTLDVRVELTDTQNNAQLWGDHYTRKATDIFAVQDEIARQVTDTLRVRLTAGQQEQVTKRYTENSEAYRLYLQGRFYLNQSSEEDFNRAVSFFGQAIALDPRYALAYAARGDTFVNMGDISLPMSEAKRKGEQDITTALSMDDKLVEARTTLANIKFGFDWKFVEAGKDYKEVIALNPNYAEAHHQYTYYLALTGRPTEAVAEMKMAQQLDPVNPTIVIDTALPYYLNRQYDEAIAQLRKALEMFPANALPHMFLGTALFQKGDITAGITEIEKAETMEKTPFTIGPLGYCYAKSGRKDGALKLISELKEQSKTRYVPAYWIGLIYAGMGEKDEAFAWLEKAYQERSWWLLWIKMDPRWDGLRSDPRLTDLLRRVGIPQ